MKPDNIIQGQAMNEPFLEIGGDVKIPHQYRDILIANKEYIESLGGSFPVDPSDVMPDNWFDPDIWDQQMEEYREDLKGKHGAEEIEEKMANFKPPEEDIQIDFNNKGSSFDKEAFKEFILRLKELLPNEGFPPAIVDVTIGFLKDLNNTQGHKIAEMLNKERIRKGQPEVSSSEAALNEELEIPEEDLERIRMSLKHKLPNGLEMHSVLEEESNKTFVLCEQCEWHFSSEDSAETYGPLTDLHIDQMARAIEGVRRRVVDTINPGRIETGGNELL